MNITFNNDSLSISSIDATGEFFQVEDQIGFTNADGENGFNRINTSYVKDEEVNPKLSELALILYVYLNQEKDSLPVIPITVNGENIRIDSDTSNYKDVSFKFNVQIKGDGWYTIYGFLLPVNTNTGIYFDSTSYKIMDAAKGYEIAANSLIGNELIPTVKIEKFITPFMERKLSDYIGILADIGNLKGYNNYDYKTLQQKILFMDAQLMGSIIKFNDGYMYEAQETITNLEKNLPFMGLK